MEKAKKNQEKFVSWGQTISEILINAEKKDAPLFTSLRHTPPHLTRDTMPGERMRLVGYLLLYWKGNES
jgi:hypothetical protein